MAALPTWTDQMRALEGVGENLAAINAGSLEHTAGIMERMGEHMDLRVRPRHQRAVHPNETVPLVIWKG